MVYFRSKIESACRPYLVVLTPGITRECVPLVRRFMLSFDNLP